MPEPTNHTPEVLIVDDDETIRATVAAILRTQGIRIRTAGNGREGLDECERRAPDLILLDMMMPVMSGNEFLRTLHRDKKLAAIPVILLTAFDSRGQHSKEFWKQGFGTADFIQKPFEPADLLQRVDAVLRGVDPEKKERPRAVGVEPEALPLPKMHELEAAPPDTVVRAFIEAWNEKRFGLEYHCLMPSLSGGMNETDYAQRRLQAYVGEHGDATRQRLESAIMMLDGDDRATVEAAWTVKRPGGPERNRALFRLMKTAKGWKITRITPR